jgi:antibiotic biosynthesis monooxygenase (ABM) superfamily enzyme
MASATAVTIIHRPLDQNGFDEWVAALRNDSRRATGFVESVLSVHTDDRLDLALAVTFSDEDLLNDWLDGPSREAVLGDGAQRGFYRASSDLVLVEGELTPPGVAVFHHTVAAGRDLDFTSAQGDLTRASSAFAGYEGTVVFPPGVSGEWTSLIRFRTERLLSEWLKSDQRQVSLDSLRSTLDREFSTVAQTTPFGTTVRIEDGRTRMTPNWKSAMLVLMVLYPTVMLLSRFVGPILDGWGAEPWLAMWLSEVASVSLLQWVLMPFAVKRMRRWLDPVDGAGVVVSLRGAAVVLGVYAVTLGVFASVRWLQYWDFGS